jgi:8-oxo-dGTP diphosphatase
MSPGGSHTLDSLSEGKTGSFAAVLDDKGRVLIVQERKEPHRFGFPGGRVEPEEALDAGAVRECKEETGLSVEVRYLVGTYDFTNGTRAVVFRCARAGGGNELRTEAGLIGGWYRPDEIPQPFRGSLYYALPDVLAGRQNVARAALRPLPT